MAEKQLDIELMGPLSDEPVDQDKFKGQSHDNVAKALVKLITKNEGGYAIGLEGSWGSGKSTVINIAKNKLNREEDNEELLFFPFDAWARQGDPIRRSFLELLIKFLSEKGIINKNNWSKTLQEIQSRTQEETKYSKPSFTRFGKMMAVYGLLFPFLVILTREVSVNSSFETTLFYILYVSILIPTFLIIIEKNIQWFLGEEDNDSLVPSIRLSHHKISTEQFIREKDTTTIEFNKYFDDLVNEVVKNGRKLVVVIDNLDRLSPDAIKSIWGTMRNFFTSESWGERYKLLKNVYLIVPYDRQYISTIFSADEVVENKNEFTEEILKQNNRSESGFIDKTFKLSFQVSPPILSHWKSFFFEQLDKAFHDQLNDSQKHDIYKLFEFRFQSIGESITPRNIKKFVNSLVVQVIEWKNKIPVKYLALYVLHKDNITLNYRKFVESKVLDQRTRQYLTGEKWAKYLAAAYHKVDPDSALQISLGQSIRNALVNGNHSDLEDLQNNDWFASTLNFVIEENSKNWASTEPDTYSVVANTLCKIDIKNNHIEQDIWDNLAKNIRSFTNVKAPSEKLANGIEKILKNSSKHLLYEAGKYIYKPIYSDLDDDMNLKSYAVDYFDYISITYSVLEERLGRSSSLDRLQHARLPNDPKFLIYFASKIYGFKNVKLSHFRFNISSDDITQEVRNSVSGNNTFDKLPESIKGFLEANIELDWKAIAQEIQNRIGSDDPSLSSKDIGVLLSILSVLEVKGNANSVITKFSKNGTLLALLNRSREDIFSTSLIILHLISYYGLINDIKANNNVPTYGNNNSGLKYLKQVCNNSSENSEIINKLAKLSCQMGSFDSILTAVTNEDNYDLPEKVALKMINNQCINGIRVDSIINDYERIKFIDDNDKIEKFFELLDQQTFDLDSVTDLGKISVSTLKIAIDTNSEIGKNLVGKIQNDLAAIDTKEWKPILNEEGPEILLLITLVKKGKQAFLSEDFSKSLLEHSVRILEEEITLKELQKEWNLLPKALAPNIRNTFFERLYDKLVSRYHESGVYRLLKLFGDDLLQSVRVEEKADQFIKNIISGLVNSDDLEKLTWVENNFDSVQKCYFESSKESKGYLEEILKSKMDEKPDIKKKINSIAHKLDINLDWDNNGEENETENK